MTASLLNVAVIGFGRMGKIYARTIAEEVEEARLHAIVDAAEDARREAAETFDEPHVLKAPRKVWTLSDLEAVIIATPTSTHKPLVASAAREEKAIFCEKPLTLSREDTYDVLSTVREAGVPLQVGFMRRFDRAYQRVYQGINSGRIGEPIVFKSIGRDARCPDPAFADPDRSGGLILDMGIHDFDLARWLMGTEVEQVSAEAGLLVCDDLQAVNDFDNSVINLVFEDGALGSVEVSRNATYGYDVRTEVLGTDGVARVPGSVVRDPAESFALIVGDGEASDDDYLTERFGEAYRAQIHHFVECVREERTPSVTGADARAAFEIGLAATFSARTGEPVALADVRAGWTPDQAIL